MKQRRETRRVIKGTGCFSIKFRLKNSDPIFHSLHSLFHQNLSNLGQEFQYCSTAACFVLIWDFDRKVKTTALHCGKLWGVTSTLIGVKDWVVGFKPSPQSGASIFQIKFNILYTVLSCFSFFRQQDPPRAVGNQESWATTFRTSSLGDWRDFKWILLPDQTFKYVSLLKRFKQNMFSQMVRNWIKFYVSSELSMLCLLLEKLIKKTQPSDAINLLRLIHKSTTFFRIFT